MIPAARRLIAAAGAVILIAGCGGGGDGGGSSESGGAPEPKQPIAAQVPAFEKAVSSRECKDSLAVMHVVTLPDPEAGATKQNCADALYSTGGLKDFEPGKSAEFGSGAIVDGTANGKAFTPIWALDEGGEFKWIGSFGHRPQTGTDLDSPEEFERSAEAFVAALRAGDCKAAHALILPGSRLFYASEDDFCKVFKANFFASPEGLGSRLKADAGAAPAALGGTRDFAFFALATKPAGYRTLVVGRVPGAAPEVVDVVPAER